MRWRYHDMTWLPRLLALCEGSPSLINETHKVLQKFDVLFAVRLNMLLDKQLSRSWCSCDVTVMNCWWFVNWDENMVDFAVSTVAADDWARAWMAPINLTDFLSFVLHGTWITWCFIHCWVKWFQIQPSLIMINYYINDLMQDGSFLHAKPWIRGGGISIFTAVIH